MTNTKRGCNCGCGKSRSIVIRELMDLGLNAEQAAYELDRGNAARNVAREANIDRYDKEREASKAAHPAGGSR